jgi:hypothetical protein
MEKVFDNRITLATSITVPRGKDIHEFITDLYEGGFNPGGFNPNGFNTGNEKESDLHD